MSHIIVKKLISDRHSFAGREWWYQFRVLDSTLNEEQVSKYVSSLARQYSAITKNWNNDINSEWICRNFMALKMILSASVMLQSLEYAEDHNLRIVHSYLQYYSMLSTLRAVLFTSPVTNWDSGDLIKMEHSRIINIGCDIVSRFDNKIGPSVKNDIRKLKTFREYISYRAPSNGDTQHKMNMEPASDIVTTCQLLAEIAQLQSEILEKSIGKNVSGKYIFKSEFIAQVCNTEIDGDVLLDSEDAYRLGYFQRKHPLPSNVCFMMSEGHVEDFFGAWCDKQERKEAFDPDENWGIIFDVP